MASAEGRRCLIASLVLLASMLGCVRAVTPASGSAKAIPTSERRSGFEFMRAETQSLQRDDTANPGMLWVADGAALFSAPAGTSNRACADCHPDRLAGVAARYPAYDPGKKAAIDLAQRINTCRTRQQRARPLAPESRDLLALNAFVAHQSRGLPIQDPARDPRLARAIVNGRTLYMQRIGQLNLSCAQCHDRHWGRRLAGNVIPQAHPTGYPLYRLEWQGLGSLQRRLRNCMTGVRAEPYDYGSQEMIDLEVFLASRAAGLAIETPAVRP
ncbi:MAG: sulfur oxidation c-type cytochrome SoxA [Gammaproteobacteria bacterium]